MLSVCKCIYYISNFYSIFKIETLWSVWFDVHLVKFSTSKRHFKVFFGWMEWFVEKIHLDKMNISPNIWI